MHILLGEAQSKLEEAGALLTILSTKSAEIGLFFLNFTNFLLRKHKVATILVIWPHA